jgi:hypothetical protein
LAGADEGAGIDDVEVVAFIALFDDDFAGGETLLVHGSDDNFDFAGVEGVEDERGLQLGPDSEVGSRPYRLFWSSLLAMVRATKSVFLLYSP